MALDKHPSNYKITELAELITEREGKLLAACEAAKSIPAYESDLRKLREEMVSRVSFEKVKDTEPPQSPEEESGETVVEESSPFIRDEVAEQRAGEAYDRFVRSGFTLNPNGADQRTEADLVRDQEVPETD